MQTAIMLIALASTAPGVEEAMRRLGPAYMCAPAYEYRLSLKALEHELMAIGVPDLLAGFAVSGVDDYIKREQSDKAASITAEECAEKYGVVR